MPRLFHAPRSPFAFKTRIVVHELGLTDRVALVEVDPWTAEELRAHNPFCKVPTLVLDDGGSLYDSPLICEYLNGMGERSLTPSDARRWDVLRHEALADGLAEAAIRRYLERLDPASDRSRRLASRQDQAIAAALDELNRIAGFSTGHDASTGDVATAATLTYLSFRSPEIEWRSSREALAAWFADFVTRPSVVAADFRYPAPA